MLARLQRYPLARMIATPCQTPSCGQWHVPDSCGETDERCSQCGHKCVSWDELQELSATLRGYRLPLGLLPALVVVGSPSELKAVGATPSLRGSPDGRSPDAFDTYDFGLAGLPSALQGRTCENDTRGVEGRPALSPATTNRPDSQRP